ncbi:MAG: hypothetical protein M3345_08140 [Actinomycetota bacterium]|nr:hypothetical protein [Actinomycetota bacterium]
MKQLTRVLTMLMMAVLLAGSVLVPVASATRRGIVLDQGSFSGSIPAGYTGSSDFDACEYRRYSLEGIHYQQLFTRRNDSCDPHTLGAPHKGDVSIYQRYNVNPGEYYKAWAVTRMINPYWAVAQVKLIYRDLQRRPAGVAECYGKTRRTSFTAVHTGEDGLVGLNGNPRPVRSASGGCLVPDGVDQVAVHFRVRARAVRAYGKAALDHLRFGRCRDNGDCSIVPAP